MKEKKRATRRISIKSDLRKVDAHKIAPHEYEEAPELTEAQLAVGVLERGGTPVRRGRPKLDHPKAHVSLRLDPDVLAFFKARGARWQSEINTTLRRAMQRKRA
jgi:uncharacterized protein (DUF4415 family)